MEDIGEELRASVSDFDEDCSVCGEKIPTLEGVRPEPGEEYAAIRYNQESSGFSFTETYVHRKCLSQYLDESEDK